MTILQTILAAVNWDTRVNENFASVSPAAMYAFDPLSANLTLRIKGGLFGSATVADYSSALTASSGNNYVVYARADGSISRSTGTTNWNDDATYGRIGIANAGATTFTWSDQRTGPFVPPAGGTVASVNGQSGVVSLGLEDLDDVDTTGVADGDALVYDAATSTWVPGAGGGGGSGTVTSVDITPGTGIAATGGPVTSSGAITVGLNGGAQASLALADTALQSVQAGTNVTIDNTDPQNPIISASGGGGGGGTVTSVGVSSDASVADLFVAQYSPVTSAGTIVLNANDLGADKVWGWDDSANKAAGFAPTYGLKTNGTDLRGALQTLAFACSDLTTNITVGNGKAYIYVPYDFTVVEVQASLDTAQTAGSIFTVDINEGGASILSTKLTIDNNEGSSITAATPPVISDASLAKGSKITVDVDQVGTAGAKGLIVYLVGYPT